MKIRCINCSAIYEINDPLKAPKSCEHCQEDLEWSEIEEASAKKEIVAIVWKNQRNASGFRFSKTTEDIYLIGRQHIGSEILGDILQNNVPIISRKHCSIEFIDDKVFIKDENSANGTCIGVEKINCANQQLLKDNDLIWLATEPFTVTFEYKIQDIAQGTNIETKCFRCKQCGNSFDFNPDDNICQSCGEYNSLIAV